MKAVLNGMLLAAALVVSQPSASAELSFEGKYKGQTGATITVAKSNNSLINYKDGVLDAVAKNERQDKRTVYWVRVSTNDAEILESLKMAVLIDTDELDKTKTTAAGLVFNWPEASSDVMDCFSDMTANEELYSALCFLKVDRGSAKKGDAFLISDRPIKGKKEMRVEDVLPRQK